MPAAEPALPLALATDTVAAFLATGACVGATVAVTGADPPGTVVTAPLAPGAVELVVPRPPSSLSSLVTARRIRNPATTAMTASTMLSVEPTGDPLSPTRGLRREPRSGSTSAGPSGASVMPLPSCLSAPSALVGVGIVAVRPATIARTASGG
jgi:hypothetical protein